jgi:hypothetical protein
MLSELTKIHSSADIKSLDDSVKDVEYILKTALSLEQEQLKEAWNDGYKKSQQDIVTNSFSTFEQYQNEKNG